MSDERDPETFDDIEFYSTLLKEFLESNSAPGLALQNHSVRAALIMRDGMTIVGVLPCGRAAVIDRLDQPCLSLC